MKKFKLVYWSDCRGMEIDGVSVLEFKSNKEVLEYLIEDKVENEDWIDYVNNVLNLGSSDIDWVEDKSKWEDMFLIGGKLDDSEFEIDFSNELNSCLVLREDSRYFEYDFSGVDGCDLVEDIESLFN